MTSSVRSTVFSPFFAISLFMILFSLPQTSFCQPEKNTTKAPEMIMARLQQTYDEITSLSFSFIQTMQGQLSGRSKKGYGDAFFIKDGQGGKMRWNYHGPEAQVLVSDGENFSMYFAKLQQMIVAPSSAMRQEIMYSFFSGTGKLQDSFTATAPDSTVAFTNLEGDMTFQVIKLVPKETQSQVNNIHLFITEDSLIKRIEIRDHFDTQTILKFTNLQVNSLNLDDKQALRTLFTFIPPEDTEIIHQ